LRKDSAHADSHPMIRAAESGAVVAIFRAAAVKTASILA
jgi:hypothetical protein